MHCSPITAESARLGEGEAAQLLNRLTGWRIHEIDGEPRLEKDFSFGNFKQAVEFTDRVAKLADEEDHHPALLTEWGRVTVTWWTHKIKGLHGNDFIMAARTNRLFEEAPGKI